MSFLSSNNSIKVLFKESVTEAVTLELIQLSKGNVTDFSSYQKRKMGPKTDHLVNYTYGVKN